MHAFRISECYLDFSCMDAIGPLNLAVFRTDEIHRHNSRPQLCKPINLLQFMRAAQLSYRLNRWNVRLRNVRLTSTRSFRRRLTHLQPLSRTPASHVHSHAYSPGIRLRLLTLQKYRLNVIQLVFQLLMSYSPADVIFTC